MKLKSKHLVEILKNISDYHYGKPMLYRMLSESLDNDNIINTSHEEDILINNILNEYPSLKEYLQKEGVFNKENVFSKDLESIGDLFIENTIAIAKYSAECINTGKRPDLERRALFIHNTVEIILHECSEREEFLGTIIEFVKKES
jgi:hypothetical protein